MSDMVVFQIYLLCTVLEKYWGGGYALRRQARKKWDTENRLQHRRKTKGIPKMMAKGNHGMSTNCTFRPRGQVGQTEVRRILDKNVKLIEYLI